MSALVVRNLSEEALAEIERLAEQNGVDPGEQAGRMLSGLVGAGPPPGARQDDGGHAEEPLPEFETMGEVMDYLNKKYPEADIYDGEITRARGGIRKVDFGEADFE